MAEKTCGECQYHGVRPDGTRECRAEPSWKTGHTEGYPVVHPDTPACGWFKNKGD